MAELSTGRTVRSGAGIPLTLLLLVLGATAGTVIWLTLVSDGAGPDGSYWRAAEIWLTEGAGAGTRQPQPRLASTGKTAADGPKSAAAGALSGSTKAEPAGLRPASPPPEDGRVPAPSLPPGWPKPSPVFKLVKVARGPPLSLAPDPALVRRSGHGLLPVVGADGRKPWQVYARPFDRADRRPRVAVVITGLGLSSAATEAAIQGLPGPVTLAFAPYTNGLGEWIRLARAAGHEVMLSIPMEPLKYPDYDPGPQALLTTLSASENRDRLLWTLSRVTGYIGVTDFRGSRFSMSPKHLRPVLKDLHSRGLMFLDSRTAPRSQVLALARDIGLPLAVNTRFIDDRASRKPIDTRLEELEKAAKKNGRAVGMGLPYPVTLERLAYWASGLERRGVVIAPVSAMAAVESAK